MLYSAGYAEDVQSLKFFFKIALPNKPVLKYFTHRVCGHRETMKIQILASTFVELKRNPIRSTDEPKEELVFLAKATIKYLVLR